MFIQAGLSGMVPGHRRAASVSALLAIAVATLLSGCATEATLLPAGPEHPASPQAAAAPLPQLPATLDVEAVEKPMPQMMDHSVHQHHNM